jgi:Beta protein
MAITYLHYVPVLKWRQGEYQALWRLDEARKTMVVPLIEITPPDFDFELWQPKKTIDAHLEKFASRLQQKWGVRPALIDTGLLSPNTRMTGNIHPLTWLLDQVRSNGAILVPVTGLERDAAYQAAVRAGHKLDGAGGALRCSLEEAADPGFADAIETLLDAVDFDIDFLDVLIDLKSPNFEPIDGLAQLLASVLSGSRVFDHARSVTILGTAFPASMAEVTGPVQFLRRSEWLLYKALVALLPPSAVRPAFGDYCIATPDLPQNDMRLLKPSATVRYAVDDGWIVVKGVNVRDNGYDQYRTCCGTVTTSAAYLGAGTG